MNRNMSVEEQLFHRMMRMPRVLREAILRESGLPDQGFGCGRHGRRCGEGPHQEMPMGAPQGGPGHCHGHGGHGGEVPQGGPGHCHGHGGEVPQGGPGHCHGHGGPHRRMLSRERVLSALLLQEEAVRQKTIAEELGVAPSSMSEFVDHLEAGGYIERTVDPADKRATLIALTEKGRARAWELEDEKRERFAAAFRKLTEEEKAELLRLLDKLAAPDEE